MTKSPDTGRVEPEFRSLYEFPFDDFQLKAFERIRNGSSVMVAAPTSAGKTVIATYALWQTLHAHRRSIYTTPIKALSNQKRQELEGLFGGNVGLLTGDRSENREAPILVMTTEVLRNMLLDDPASLADVGCIVFDEVHYLADPDRGTIWEESIIMCLPQIQLVCLSATMANASEIASWISQTHRPISLIRHDVRPVPLEHYAFGRSGLILIREVTGKRVRRVAEAVRRHPRHVPRVSPEEVVQSLRRADLLPAIWFAFTRRGVEADAEQCAAASPETTGLTRTAIETAIDRGLESIPAEDRALGQIEQLLRLLRRGVGFHHAGLLPPCKELVEGLFSQGLLYVVCATDTLSVGMNMPARTVVLSSISRPVAGLLTPNDFRQLTGRAGRRGIDKRGAVVILPDAFHDFERGYAAITGPLEPIRSAFRLRYSTLLSLYSGDRPEERLTALVASSLRQFQMGGDERQATRRLIEINAAIAALPAIPELDGREDELDQYLELQRRLTASERIRPGTRNDFKRSGKKRSRRGGVSPEAAALKALLRSHPLHGVASQPEFQSAAAARISLLRERNRLQRAAEVVRLEREREAKQTARAVSAVLRTLDYVDRYGPRPKASGLREIVAPSGIVLSEMYHEGFFSTISPAELAEVLSWFASDVDRRRYNTYRLPHQLTDLRTKAEMVYRRISLLEEQQGIRLSQGPSSWFWGVALAWCQGDSVDQLSSRIEAAEGDIVSTLNKTVDLMDQFKALLIRYDDYVLLATTDTAHKMLSRGLVAMMRTEGDVVFRQASIEP